MNEINFTLSTQTIENLQHFSRLLNKDVSKIIDEALAEYFTKIQKQLFEKQLEEENEMTNLDYDEFWGDVDLNS
jgi:hypothetical protein